MIQENGKLPYFFARIYAALLVNAIEYMHSQNIIHRDLKPLNILLDSDQYLKIVSILRQY